MTIPKMAPIAASGREQRMAIGALIDLNVMTMIKNTIPMETSMIKNKSVKSSACWHLLHRLGLLHLQEDRFLHYLFDHRIFLDSLLIEISDSFAGSTDAVT